MYSESQKEALLKLARQSILHYFKTSRTLKVNQTDIDEDYKRNRAVFVTLSMGGDLRGCIGSLEATQPLYKDIIENSVRAAFFDPRFEAVSEEELNDISIEISVLSKPEKIPFSGFEDLINKITPFKDGIVLKKGIAKATYLPQVWKQIPKAETFLSSLCVKAGLDPESWKDNDIEIEKYHIEEFSEPKKTAA